MSGDETESGIPNENAVNQETPGTAGLEADPDEMKKKPLMNAEKLSEEINRFSGLTSELTGVLSRLSREVQISAEQLNQAHAALEAKHNELKTLYGLEASAATLEGLVRDNRQQKEDLQRQIEEQRAAWELEISKREQEESQYQENLRIRRQRDEEEYKQRWAAEKLKAQQKFEEELRVIHQEALQRQQARERDCLDRELKLKEKELEWVQLIQELEQFMSKLTRRTQAQTAAYSDLLAKEGRASSEQSSDPPVAASDAQAEPAAAADANPLDKPETISSLKEMLVSQGRRIETLSTETPDT
jgi:colicin import membrane protein